jgi:hypothetical protein
MANKAIVYSGPHYGSEHTILKREPTQSLVHHAPSGWTGFALNCDWEILPSARLVSPTGPGGGRGIVADALGGSVLQPTEAT